MTFGIPTRVLPLTDHGEADSWQHHYDWISSRQSIEAKELEEVNQLLLVEREKAYYYDEETACWQQRHYDSIRKSIEAKNLEAKEEQKTPSNETSKDDCIDVPRPTDVLMGREWLARSHTGNTRYQSLIDEYQERYDTCETSIEKTIIASEIVIKVKEYGGRFLLRKKGETSNWSEADDWLAREKVTNAFRGRRKAAAARSKRRIIDNGEYFVMKKKMRPNGQVLPLGSGPASRLSADAATLNLTNQKNGMKGAVIHNDAIFEPHCPVQSLARDRRVSRILASTTELDAPLCAF
jgi:hypothetical protein